MILCENPILFPALLFPFAAASWHRRVSMHIYKKGRAAEAVLQGNRLDFIQAPKICFTAPGFPARFAYIPAPYV
ncbi:hypothetical protein, partial [Gemmiger sp.]|uniref:hypothetical protein n=1 Tax=Gemmiger sp. TaxID=2049027 RepID=UPI003A93BCF4